MALTKKKRVGQPMTATPKKKPIKTALKNIVKTAGKIYTTPFRVAANVIKHPKTVVSNSRYLEKRNKPVPNTAELISKSANEEVQNEIAEKATLFADENPDLLNEKELSGEEDTIQDDEAGEIINADMEEIEQEGYDFFDLSPSIIASNGVFNGEGFDIQVDSFDEGENFEEFKGKLKKSFKKAGDKLAKPLDFVLQNTNIPGGKLISKIRQGVVENAKKRKDEKGNFTDVVASASVAEAGSREELKNKLFPETKKSTLLFGLLILVSVCVVAYIVVNKKK